MMTILSVVLSAGLWPAIPVAGALALRWKEPRAITARLDLLTRWAVYTILGIALWSLPLLASGSAGFYSTPALGLFGWLVIALRYTIFKGRGNNTLSSLNREHWLLLVLLAALGFLYHRNPTESFAGGRDEGVYANHAVYIANHGTFDVDYPWDTATDSTSDELMSGIFDPYPGLFPTRPAMEVQFVHLYPLWMAQAYGTFGYQGIVRFNGVLALVGLTIIYLIARRLMDPPFALLAVLILGANAGQVYTAHNTLSEIITQAMVWGAVLMLMAAVEEDDSRLAGWAGICFGATILFRIDSLLFLPMALIGAAFVALLRKEGSMQGRPYRWFMVCAIPVFLGGMAHNAIYSDRYISFLIPQLTMIGYATAGAALILGLSMQRHSAGALSRIVGMRHFPLLLGATLAGIAAYALWIRPVWEPFHQFQFLSGVIKRDYREEALPNLARYLSLPVIVLSVAGAWRLGVSLFRAGQGGTVPELKYALAFALAVGCSAVYLWNPSISSIHYWGVRRYIPVIIPAASMLALVGLAYLTGFLHKYLRMGIAGLFSLFLLYHFYSTNELQLTYTEEKNYFTQVQELAGLFPDDAVIFSDDGDQWAKWETPLFMAFDKKVIPTSLHDPGKAALVRTRIQQGLSRGERIYLAYQSDRHLEGLELGEKKTGSVTRLLFETPALPFPERTVMDFRKITVARITNVISDFVDVDLGNRKVFGVEEGGFHLSVAGSRWTNGDAVLHVPVNREHFPGMVRASFGTPVASSVQLYANDVEIFSRQVPAGEVNETISLASVPPAEKVHLRIVSSTFIPAKALKGSRDTRTLGVNIHSICFLDSVILLPGDPLPISACRSRLELAAVPAVIGSAPVTVDVKIENRGDKPWPSLTDLGGSRGAVRLGAVWYAEGSDARRLGEERVDLRRTLMPGKHLGAALPLRGRDYQNRPLPKGRYSVKIGLLQEGVAWFSERGDTAITVQVALQ